MKNQWVFLSREVSEKQKNDQLGEGEGTVGEIYMCSFFLFFTVENIISSKWINMKKKNNVIN